MHDDERDGAQGGQPLPRADKARARAGTRLEEGQRAAEADEPHEVAEGEVEGFAVAGSGYCVPRPATQDVDEQIGAQVAQRDAPGL